jgi:hypothetical protein
VFASSSDGQYAVGGSVTTPTTTSRLRRAFRWSPSGVDYLPLPAAGELDCAATAVSGDGSIVAGVCTGLSNSVNVATPFLWSEATGTVSLDQILLELGVDTSLYQFADIADVSADGTAVVGNAFKDGVGIGWRAYVDSVFP